MLPQAITVIVFVLLVGNAGISFPQTKSERVGAATGEYWGALVIMESISKSRCASHLSLNGLDLDLKHQRTLIEKRVEKFLTQRERAQFQRMLDSGEVEMRGLLREISLTPMTDAKCREVVTEFTNLYNQKKYAWEHTVR